MVSINALKLYKVIVRNNLHAFTSTSKLKDLFFKVITKYYKPSYNFYRQKKFFLIAYLRIENYFLLTFVWVCMIIKYLAFENKNSQFLSYFYILNLFLTN